MPNPGLQQEAADASVDFIVAHGEAPLTRHRAFVAGYLAAAEPRDRRIKRLQQEVKNLWRAADRIHTPTILEHGDLDG